MEGLYHLFSMINKEVALLIVSMIPLVELRGAVPMGIAMDMSWYNVLPIAILGNILPIPFILLLGQKIFALLKKVSFFEKLITKYETRLLSKADGVRKYAAIGLMLFVGVPVPGTGAWSGAVLATLLEMKFKTACLSIIGGVVMAGVIMTVGSCGVAGIIHLFS